jgi:hypothetical protein
MSGGKSGIVEKNPGYVEEKLIFWRKIYMGCNKSADRVTTEMRKMRIVCGEVGKRGGVERSG